jgi:hypothetical protein
MHPTGKIDIFAPAYTINESFDCPPLTAVLEHRDKREGWTWIEVVVAKKQPMEKVVHGC